MRLPPWALLFAISSGAALAQPRPDVRAVAVSGPEVAVAGESVVVTSTFAADAAGARATFRWAAYLTADGAIDGALPAGTFGPVTLEPGASRVVTQAITVPRAARGFFTIAVLADSAAALTEPNELDNLARATTRIRVRPPLPDIALVSAELVDREARPGEPVRVRFVAENRGELAAAFTFAAVAGRDPDPSTSDVPLGEVTRDVAAGARVTAEIAGVVPADLPSGAWTIGVLGDPDDARPEITETNATTAPESLRVVRDTLAITTPSLPEATAGFDYHAKIEAQGGDGAFTFRLRTGALPEGLSLDASTGVIAGRPLAPSTSTVALEVTSRALTATADFALEIRGTGAPLVIVSERVADARLGLPYEETLVAAGGEAPYTWSTDPARLPPGLTLDEDGVLAGTADTAGRFTFAVTARDRRGATDDLELTVDVAPASSLTIRDADPPPTPVGVALDHPLEVAGGIPPYRWQALSDLPPGLTLTETGHVTGVPAAIGRFPVLVRASDATRTGARDDRLIQIVLTDDGALQLTTESLPRAGLRVPYRAELAAAGGTPPYTWRVVRGDAAPSGFFIETAETGEVALRGTAVRATAHGFGVEVEDAVGRRARRTFILEAVSPDALDASGCTTARTSGGTTRDATPATLVALLLASLAVRRRIGSDHSNSVLRTSHIPRRARRDSSSTRG